MTKTPRQCWIEDTQMFQRIAGTTPESSSEELGAEYDSWKRPRQKREVESIRTHRVIQDVARRVI